MEEGKKIRIRKKKEKSAKRRTMQEKNLLVCVSPIVAEAIMAR
jgi:hypothetical protein